MSVGSCIELTGGCVSVCTKSVFGAAVDVVAVVVVMVGTDGIVDSVAVGGVTTGFFLVRHAGARTAASIARLKANDFTALLIVPPSYQVGSWRWQLTDTLLTANCQLPSITAP